MAENNSAIFPLLTIAALVDPTTAVLVGDRLDEVSVGDDLYVLGIGSSIIPGAEVPLVVPKRTIEVTANAGRYLVARTPVEERTVVVQGLTLGSSFRELMQDQVKTVIRREPMVEGKFEFLGNPATLPVKIGDVVIKTQDLEKYVNWLSKQQRTD